jgi:hypothetical protein
MAWSRMAALTAHIPKRGEQMVRYTTYAPQGSPNPRDLWKWLARYEERTGGDILALAHNGNLSNGIMFPFMAQWEGTKLDNEYVTQRAKCEPLYEVTQIKGDGEAHPSRLLEDEVADYETWDIGNLKNPPDVKTDDMLASEYAREALKRGLALEARLGKNPYKFGMVGSTDSHTALATAQEDNFFGKHSGAEPSPERMGNIAPTFMVYALRDPIGGNLGRIQIIKGWIVRARHMRRSYPGLPVRL